MDLEAGLPVGEIVAGWEDARSRFVEVRTAYVRY
jgi:hypothetical protein